MYCPYLKNQNGQSLSQCVQKSEAGLFTNKCNLAKLNAIVHEYVLQYVILNRIGAARVLQTKNNQCLLKDFTSV